MPFTPSTPTTSVTWTNSSAAISNTWANNAITEVYDRLIDIAGNYIIDIDGNYISLGGGITESTPTTGSTWTNPTAISTTWTVGS